jgi:hypothetical protein
MATNLARWLKENNHSPLLVCNRSEDGVEGFQAWAKDKGVAEDAYIIMEDLEEIAKVYVVRCHTWMGMYTG